MRKPIKRKIVPSAKDMSEARAIIASCFPYGPLPEKYSPRGAPARWVFDLVLAVAIGLAKRSQAKGG